MGHTNAKYFCLEHPKRSTKSYCKTCMSSMCSSCVEKNENICPACRREFFIESDNFVDKKMLLIILFFGFLALFITYYSLVIKYEDNALEHLFPQGFIYFFLGISAAYTPVLFSNKDFFYEDIKKVPFIGFKLLLIAIVVTIISFIPAVIYLIKVFKYFVYKDELK